MCLSMVGCAFWCALGHAFWRALGCVFEMSERSWETAVTVLPSTHGRMHDLVPQGETLHAHGHGEPGVSSEDGGSAGCSGVVPV